MEKLLDLCVQTKSEVLSVHVKNRSSHQLNLWSRLCSWGWETVSFEVAKSEQQHVWHNLTVMSVRWTANYPEIVKLPPNGQITFDFSADRSVWNELEQFKNWQDQSIHLRAKLRIEESIESKEYSVLTGEVQSPFCLLEPPHKWLFNTAENKDESNAVGTSDK